MDEARILATIQSIVDVLTRQAASHRALERAVFALVATHPDPETLLKTLDAHLELDAVDDLNSHLMPDAETAYEAQRARLRQAVADVINLRRRGSADGHDR